MQRRIYELTDPPLVLGVEAHTVAGARLLVVTVPGSPDVHAVKGRSTERIGASCREMSTARIAQVVGERRGDDRSAGDSGRPVTAASTRALEEARRLLATAPDPARRRYAALGDADLLSRLGLVHRHGTLTHAGAVLFTGADGGPAGLAYVFRRTASGELVANERFARSVAARRRPGAGADRRPGGPHPGELPGRAAAGAGPAFPQRARRAANADRGERA